MTLKKGLLFFLVIVSSLAAYQEIPEPSDHSIVPQKSISRYETGAAVPSLETLMKNCQCSKKAGGVFFR